MKADGLTDNILREFLLGSVEGSDRERIESLFLTDPETKEKVLAAEQELLDDYLDDRLSHQDRERFLTEYADTEVQQGQLQIAKSIKEWALLQNDRSVASPPVASIWAKFIAWLQVKRTILVPLTVAVVLAIVIAVFWLTIRTRELRNRHTAIEQELAQLNTPSNLQEVQSPEPPLLLKPGSVRSLEAQPELNVGKQNAFAELNLLWMQKESYSNYRAVIRRDGEDDTYTIPNLGEEQQSGRLIRLRLSTHLLKPGSYRVDLIGTAKSGTSSLETYNFRVSN